MDHLYYPGSLTDLHVRWEALRTAAVVAVLVAFPFAIGFRAVQKRRSAQSLRTTTRSKLTKAYDVVVVGGGTAGCVLASRLSEDPAISVLLLEAGPSARGLELAETPVGFIQFMGSDYDYGLHTEAQADAAGRKRYWPRARLLGGCSNINAMITHYGAPSDYDEWSRIQQGQPGASEWSYQNLQPYFCKFEKYNPSDRFLKVDRELHGMDGPYHTGHFGYLSSLAAAFIKACQTVGIPRSYDVNTYKGTMGVTEVMTYIQPNRKRTTAEVAYLTPDVLARPNLKVVTEASVTRLVFEKKEAETRVIGVEFKLADGSKSSAKASKEVIVCAGAVHTPHILMLSGIGPASHLSSFGIPVVDDLPAVGSHLKDHLTVDLGYMDKSKRSLSFLIPSTITQQLQAMIAQLQHNLTGRGPLTTNVADAIAFLRSDDPKLFPLSDFPASTAPGDTTSGKDAPDIEVYCTPIAYNEHTTAPAPNNGHYNFMLHPVLLRPKSSGTIRLRSADPDDPPVIDPRYLSEPNDVKTFLRGVRLVDRIAHAEPLAGILDPAGDGHPELHHGLSNCSDEEVEELVRQRAETLYHPCCTARMAPKEDGGVVDACLRVHGVPNLRVADASVFPSIVSGHTTGPVLAVAEKAADLVKRDVSGRRTSV